MAEGGFSPEFREYMERELYDSSRVEVEVLYNLYSKKRGWVFWDRRDDHSVVLNPNFRQSLRVRHKIRGALRKLISDGTLADSLIQFWAPIKTLEGRTYLTVQNQPFALGSCNFLPSRSREFLCQYRMGIYNLSFDANAECAEEQLGLPAHVFLHELPEFAPYLSYNTLDIASSCKIKASWAVPVFENYSGTSVGVLEIASHSPSYPSWDGDEFVHYIHYMDQIFQKFDLSYHDESRDIIMQCEDKNGSAFMELQVACKSAFEIPEVNFALAWVSSCSCSDLLQCLFTLPIGSDLVPLLQVLGIFHFRKVQVIGSKLLSSNLLYCSDVRQLSIYESLLKPFVGGCFTMCLQSSNAAELYVIQFFLSKHINGHKNKLTKFRSIMDTMKGDFKTLRLANGQEWGKELPLEVIDFRKDRKIQYIGKIPATRCTPLGLEFLKDESQNSNSPCLGSLLDGKEVMEVDSSDQKGHSIESVPTTGCLPSQWHQPSPDSINNCMHAFSEAQNSFMLSDPSLDSLPKGIAMMQVDSFDQKGHSVESVPATGCIPSQWRQPLADSINIGMYVFSEAQNSYVLSDPSLNSSQNGIVMMQLDSSDQASVNPSNIFGDLELSLELNSNDRVSAAGTFRKPGIKDANTVTIKAKVENYDHLLQFSLSLPPRLVELQDKVAERKPEAGACDVFCIDKDNGSILIGCDDELQQWIDKSRSFGNTSTRVFLRPKQLMAT